MTHYFKILGQICVCTAVIFLPTYESASSLKPQLVLNNRLSQWWTNPGPWLRAPAKPRPKPTTFRKLTLRSTANFNVMLNSYDFGITVLAVVESISQQEQFPILNPTLAYYNTNAYRWIRRLLSLYPDLLHGKFTEPLKVWRRRFYYEDMFMPSWLKHSIPWVDEGSWDTEKDASQRYHAIARHVFDRYDRYPPKKFNSRESFSNSSSIFYPGPPDEEF